MDKMKYQTQPTQTVKRFYKNVTARNLTPEELENSKLPDKRTNSIQIKFESPQGRNYTAVHIFDGPEILLVSNDRDFLDFEHVRDLVAQESEGSVESITDRDHDICSGIGLKKRLTQAHTAQLMRRYSEHFKDVEMSVGFRGIPEELYKNSGLPLEKLSTRLLLPEVTLKQQDIGDGILHWMLETDKEGLERIIEAFELHSTETSRGIIEAYKALTSEESRRATIQIGHNNEQDEKDVMRYIEQGKAERFGTANLEGNFRDYPDVHITIWHPGMLSTSLTHEACNNYGPEQCKGSIFPFEDREPSFSIHRDSKQDMIDYLQKRISKKEEERVPSQYIPEIEQLTRYQTIEDTHKQHEQELLDIIKDIQTHFPELRKGTIWRSGIEKEVTLDNRVVETNPQDMHDNQSLTTFQSFL